MPTQDGRSVGRTLPDDVFVIDSICHALNWDPSNWRFPKYASALGGMFWGMCNGSNRGPLYPWRITQETFERDWPIDETANILFLESDTDLSTFVPLDIRAFHDGLCLLDKAREVTKRWPDRFLVEATVDPYRPDAVERFEEQVETFPVKTVALKLYPSSWTDDGVHRGVKLSDPEVCFPLFEKARQLGIKVIAIHKALPLGPVPMDSYKVDDIDDAAENFPDLVFEIIHGGAAFSEETAWQLARFPNVWVNLDVTSVMVALSPRRFGEMLADLIKIGGPTVIDRIIWGTGGGSGAYHPQPCLDAFWSYEIPEDVWTQGYFVSEPYQLTEQDKRKVLGLNYARLMEIDIPDRLAKVRNDEFSQRRAAQGGRFDPWSTTKAQLITP